jgi:hypothetical protein
VLGWIGYALLPADTATFVRETLGAIAIAGIAALPVALLPLRGLAGQQVWSWNRRIWVLAYAVGLLGFFLVLMPMPFAWEGVTASLGVWVACFVAYAVVATAAWLLIVKPWNRSAPAQ